MVEIYQWAADGASCDVDWRALAGVASVASDHGRWGDTQLDAIGRLSPEIYGPVLDGSGGRLRIRDTDNGVLDGDNEFDRAVGPFQFIPATWEAVAIDGNGDGDLDPHNVWDAAASASVLICLEGGGRVGPNNQAFDAWFGTGAHNTTIVERAIVAGVSSAFERRPGVAQELAQLVFDGADPAIRPLDEPVDAQPDVVEIALRPPAANILVGDWDGDGIDEPTPYESVLSSIPIDDTSIPLVGDWDGDGDDDAGVFEDGVFHVFVHDQDPDTSDSDTSDPDTSDPDTTEDGSIEVRRIDLGDPGDIALTGDWNGDGNDDVAVAQPFDADQDGTDDSARVTFAATGFGLADTGDRYGTSFVVPLEDSLLITDLDGNGIDAVTIVTNSAEGAAITPFDRWGRPEEPILIDTPISENTAVVAGVWPRAAADPDTPISFSRAGVGATYWQDVIVADGTTRSLWFVGPEERQIAVDESIVDQTMAMIEAAAADGITLRGWGWRSFERQIELRAAHCADVWATPASQCSPPTAIPGSSRHEIGVAIDFHDGANALGRGSVEFAWLAEHAADYGFYNLPSEPWHWSIDGG